MVCINRNHLHKSKNMRRRKFPFLLRFSSLSDYRIFPIQGIADYQYVPISGNEEILDPSLEIAPLREDLPSAKHFPPPIFTKSDAPIAYNFEDNPFFQVTLNPDGTRNIAERVRLRGPKVLYQLQYTPNMVLPTEPPKDLAPANPAILAHLKTLFSAHPVLFRHHILFHLRNYSEKEVTEYVDNLDVPSLLHFSLPKFA